MIDYKYEWSKKRTNLIFWFWRQFPKSWMYWAVIAIWAEATSTEFTDKHPDEINWNMMARWLSGKPREQRIGVENERST